MDKIEQLLKEQETILNELDKLNFYEFIELCMKWKFIVSAQNNTPLSDGEAMIIMHLLKMKKDTK